MTNKFQRGELAVVRILDPHPAREDIYLIQAERGVYTLHGSSLMPLPNELDVGGIIVAAKKWRRAQQLQVKACNENQRASAAAERNQAERELAVAVDRYAARLAPVDPLAALWELAEAPLSLVSREQLMELQTRARAAILLIKREKEGAGQ